MTAKAGRLSVDESILHEGSDLDRLGCQEFIRLISVVRVDRPRATRPNDRLVDNGRAGALVHAMARPTGAHAEAHHSNHLQERPT